MKPGHILHVEDDDNDVVFLTLAAEDVGIQNPIHVAVDGQEAIAHLNFVLARSAHTPSALPCLILLDANLPHISGIEVLRWIRQQPGLNHIPVIIISGSDQSSQLQLAYESGADSYFIKPCNLSKHLAFARHLQSWILGQHGLPSSPGWRNVRLQTPPLSGFAGSFQRPCA